MRTTFPRVMYTMHVAIANAGSTWARLTTIAQRLPMWPLLLLFVLAVALALRLYGIGSDLPFMEHPDEPLNIRIVQAMFRSGDWNPHFFNYPSLFFYLHLLSYGPYFAVGQLLGAFETPADVVSPVSLAMGVTYTDLPTAVVMGRLLTTAFGLGTVALTYLVGKSLTGAQAVGIWAATLVAVMTSAVVHSRLVTPDMLAAFFVLLTLYFSLCVYREGLFWQSLFAGISAGLAVSCKYNSSIVVTAVIAAHLLRHGPKTFVQPQLYVAAAASLVCFLATSPFSLLDTAHFIADMRTAATHYATGHVGMEGESLWFYLVHAWSVSNFALFLACLGLISAVFQRDRPAIVMMVFTLPYFVFISSLAVRNDRTFLPLLAPMSVLAASAVFGLWQWVAKSSRPRWTTTIRGLLVLTILVVPIVALSATIESMMDSMKPSGRDVARAWIQENLPTGTRIAIESYGPFIDPQRYVILGVPFMIDHDPDWYGSEGYGYLVFSERIHGRFFRDPGRYGEQVEAYQAFFRRFRLEQRFTGRYEVRIYAVR